MVQRFGRTNRYAELDAGADVRWIDLLANIEDDKAANDLSRPYSADDMKAAREHLQTLTDVAPAKLPSAGDIESPRRVIRRKDLDDLFDTDPDLTGFDVDISPTFATQRMPMYASSGGTFPGSATSRHNLARRSCARYRLEPPETG